MSLTDVSSPESPEEFERYFQLRWEVLRRPLDLPRGSERDELERQSHHAVIWASDGRALAAGRLHFNSPSEAQIRYMAVADDAQRSGLGRKIVERLMEVASERGAASIVLNSRAEAVAFYEHLGFRILGAAEPFAGIPHSRMRKILAPSDRG